MDERIKQIAVHYGSQHQQLKAIEELGELIAESHCYTDEKTIISELADVEIMLEQLKFLLGIGSMVAVKKAKIEKRLPLYVACADLVSTLARYILETENINDVAEKIAMTEISIKKYESMFIFENKVLDEIENKIKRQLKRMETEKEKSK